METVDVFYSFRSPYSFLATPELMALPGKFDVAVALRPVLPLAVRQPSFFNPDSIKRAKYIRLDWVRRAEFLGIEARWPSPDPIVQNMETYEIAAEQPYIYRLSKLGVEAERQGKGIPFAYHVSHMIFGGTKDWHEGDHLATATAKAGLDLSQMDAAIEAGDHMAEIERNQDALDAIHWGVPTMGFRGEPFFGQDRIATLEWRLEKEGLKKAP